MEIVIDEKETTDTASKAIVVYRKHFCRHSEGLPCTATEWNTDRSKIEGAAEIGIN